MTQDAASGNDPFWSPQTAPADAMQDIDRVAFENFVLKRKLAARERELEVLQSATSWRLTAPLRRFAAWTRRLRQRMSGEPDRIDGQIDRDHYRAWLQKYSSVDEAMRQNLTRALDGLARRPRISVIMPSYNVDMRWLRAAIESIRNQVYADWELCISDDASTLPGTRELLNEYASLDSRIRVNLRATRGHISLNSNSALDLATGDYVALMDADDVIPEDALFWVAHEISLHPEVDLLFSDEDKIDESGRRFDPYFKSAWNPALMLSQNAFCHLGVLRRSLVEQVGRFRAGYEGSQDHDLVLRCAEQSCVDRIRHIPRVLYHWRSLAGSTASGLLSKPYAARAGFLTLADHLRRRGIAAEIEPAGEAFYQVVYRPKAPLPLASLVLRGSDSAESVERQVEALRRKTSCAAYEILIVSAAAKREGAGLGGKPDDVSVRMVACEDVSNRAIARNHGAEQARGDVVCFLDADVEPLTETWLEQLVARVCLDGVAAAAPLVCLSADGAQGGAVLLSGGRIVTPAFFDLSPGQGGYFGRAILEQDVTAVVGACLTVRRTQFQEIGGFDPNLASALCDVDLCLRLRQSGARIVWTPAARVLSKASKVEPQTEREVAVMRERWGRILDSDPTYNPNLGIDRRRLFDLASPPRGLLPLDGNRAASFSRTAHLRS